MPDDGTGRFGWPWSRTAKVDHADIRLSDRLPFDAPSLSNDVAPTLAPRYPRDTGLEVTLEVGAGVAAQGDDSPLNDEHQFAAHTLPAPPGFGAREREPDHGSDDI